MSTFISTGFSACPFLTNKVLCSRSSVLLSMIPAAFWIQGEAKDSIEAVSLSLKWRSVIEMRDSDYEVFC